MATTPERKRFFASETGVRFHQEFMNTSEEPDVEFNVLEPGAFDDAIVLAIVSRCRAAGFDAYLERDADFLVVDDLRRAAEREAMYLSTIGLCSRLSPTNRRERQAPQQLRRLAWRR